MSAPRTVAFDERVGVVIVNFNSERFLSDCLGSLARQTMRPHRVIVVDNGSKIIPPRDVLEQCAGTELIELGENVGFARANNVAIDKLDDCTWIATVNPDVVLNEDWLSAMVGIASTSPQIAGLASKLVQRDDPTLLDGAGDAYHVSGMVWRRHWGRRESDFGREMEEVFSPCAAAALYRREALQAVGGFDEEFFCYVEDVDLGFRLRLAGYRFIYVPSAVATHVGSAITGGRRSDFSVYHGQRNLIWTYVKNMPTVLFWVFLPLHVAVNLVSIVRGLFWGAGMTVLRAKLDAIRAIPKMWRRRRQIQRGRRASVIDLLSAMTVRPTR